MNPRILIPRIAPAALAALCALLFAASAHAALDSWSGLTGLNDASNASWVRVYANGAGSTIYAGTEGDGVYRSTNSGSSWTAFNSGFPDDGLGRDVYSFLVQGSTVYAGTDDGLWSNSNGTWEPVAQGAEPTPATPSRLNQAVQTVITVNGTWLAGVASGGVFRSGDGGATWQPPAPDNGMPASETVWGLTSFANFVWAATIDGIYRSADSGATWSLASDGIPFGSITLRVFRDNTNPLIYYAATTTGLYRTVNGAVTWAPMDDPDYFGGQIEDVQQYANNQQTKLYVAAYDGVWTLTAPNQSLTSTDEDMTWRHVTGSGLGNNVIMWALRGFPAASSTMLAGTQSNGGYSLSFSPPVNTTVPVVSGTYEVGKTLSAGHGVWTGTATISYTYQWQRYSSGAWHNILNATSLSYALTDDDLGSSIRVVVTASNDAPETPAATHTATSASGGPVQQSSSPTLLPGYATAPISQISLADTNNDSEPTEGETLSVIPAVWSPAPTSRKYQWLRCDSNGNNCKPIPGATGATYKMAYEDNADEIRVVETGTNTYGSFTNDPSGAVGPVIPKPATFIKPPSIAGSAVVGYSLVGGVGTWQSPATTFLRQWERCEPDGSDCEAISGANGAEYKVTSDDYGMTLRMDVTADVNLSYQLPLAVDAYTPLTAVVTVPPGVVPPLRAVPIVPPAPLQLQLLLPPKPKAKAPTLTKLKLSGQSLVFKLSASGIVKVKLERKTAGHKTKHSCAVGHKKHVASCTVWVVKETITKKGLKVGSHSIKLSSKVNGRYLPNGTYRAVVVPETSGGKAGTSHTLSLVLGKG